VAVVDEETVPAGLEGRDLRTLLHAPNLDDSLPRCVDDKEKPRPSRFRTLILPVSRLSHFNEAALRLSVSFPHADHQTVGDVNEDNPTEAVGDCCDLVVAWSCVDVAAHSLVVEQLVTGVESFADIFQAVRAVLRGLRLSSRQPASVGMLVSQENHNYSVYSRQSRSYFVDDSFGDVGEHVLLETLPRRVESQERFRSNSNNRRVLRWNDSILFGEAQFKRLRHEVVKETGFLLWDQESVGYEIVGALVVPLLVRQDVVFVHQIDFRCFRFAEHLFETLQQRNEMRCLNHSYAGRVENGDFLTSQSNVQNRLVVELLVVENVAVFRIEELH
jgi:hypothetical protein